MSAIDYELFNSCCWVLIANMSHDSRGGWEPIRNTGALGHFVNWIIVFLMSSVFLPMFVFFFNKCIHDQMQWNCVGGFVSLNAERYVGRERSSLVFPRPCLSRHIATIIYELWVHRSHAEFVETASNRRQTSSLVLLPRPSGCRQRSGRWTVQPRRTRADATRR